MPRATSATQMKYHMYTTNNQNKARDANSADNAIDITGAAWKSQYKPPSPTDQEIAKLSLVSKMAGEAAVLAFLKWAKEVDLLPVLMPSLYVCSEDTTIFDYESTARIPVVVFHADGSATVVELRDGEQGAAHVVGGIGRLGLHACQFDPAGRLKGVRRALAWTAVTDPRRSNPIIEGLCKEAGVIPLFLPPMIGLIGESLRCLTATAADPVAMVPA